MLADSPVYTAYHAPRDHSLSPSCRPVYHSPMLSPSPFRTHNAIPMDTDDNVFLNSPYRSPAIPRSSQCDDDDDGLFFASPTIQPMQPLRTPARPALTVKTMNSAAHGTKRKPTPAVLTPLATTRGDFSFDRLAPLPAPRFTSCTPHTRSDPDSFLRHQTSTMTKLNLADAAGDTDSEDEDVSDLQCNLFTISPRKGERAGEEVAEAFSPDGHVTKRRARSRPVSEELQRAGSPSPFAPINASPRITPLVFPKLNFDSPRFRNRQDSSPSSRSSASGSEAGSPDPRQRSSALTTLTANAIREARPRRIPMDRGTSSSSASLFFGPAIPQAPPRTVERAQNRRSMVDPEPSPAAFLRKDPAKTFSNARPKMPNRHSFGGAGTPWAQSPSPSPQKETWAASLEEEDFFMGDGDHSFTFSLTSGSPSPRHALPKKFAPKPRDSGIVISEDEDNVFQRRSSDQFNVPSASTSVSTASSGDDGYFAKGLVTPVEPGPNSGWPGITNISTGEWDEDSSSEVEAGLSTASRASAVVDDFIVRALAKGTKDAGPKKAPATPIKKNKTFVGGKRPWQSAVAQKIGFKGFGDESKTGKKKVPRKSMPTMFGRPGKGIGRINPDDDEDDETEETSPSSRKIGNGLYTGIGIGRPPLPRPSLGKEGTVAGRAKWLMRRSSSGAFSFSSGSEAGSVVGTPVATKGKNWQLGAPPVPSLAGFTPAAVSRVQAPRTSLRSGSGTSTSSGSTITRCLNSPSTGRTARGQVGGPRLSVGHVPGPRLSAGHVGGPRLSAGQREPRERSSMGRMRAATADDQAGKYEREFEEIDELGSGEFGKAVKARYRSGRDTRVFAVKKSKRFEGVKHRLRLREEVDVLQHLSRAAQAALGPGQFHPNVLGYLDSWEEEDALFIQTELCELGNFANFLWEYGRNFPRLDEPRVWKILADLSDGLRFIHGQGVIHLDLKPANMFLTAEGRFKIGDFGMATLWPRKASGDGASSFEREGDKVYLAPEVLRGVYGMAADVFSLGVVMLEAATNIVVPDQGEPWQRLRQEDFAQVDLEESPELFGVIRSMMRTEPSARARVGDVWGHAVVARARGAMERMRGEAVKNGTGVFGASPLAGVPDPEEFLEEILGREVEERMDVDM